MAMLAEKKRKIKWSLNPMGNDWAKDENKFGQKLLEKMGWSPGTGLGARGQGATEVIKINVKNDTLGLGVEKDKDKEVWTKQLVNFDSLLAKLNGDSEKKDMDPTLMPSLEEKSKASRARIHYHKFTRGKDLSKYSSKDLKSILPLHKEKDEKKELVSENNMYAYFSKNKKNPYKDIKQKSSEDMEQELVANESLEQDEPLFSSFDVENKKKTKKKKKNKLKDCENNVKDNIEEQISEETSCVDHHKKKKKKKSNKKYSNESDSLCLLETEVNNEMEFDDLGETYLYPDVRTQKKKKSKDKRKMSDPIHQSEDGTSKTPHIHKNSLEINETSEPELAPKKKKRKNNNT